MQTSAFINTCIYTMLSDWINATHTCNSLPDLSGGQSYTCNIDHYKWAYAIILMMLWEDLPCTCGLVFAAESAALAVCTPERLYIRPNGLHLVVGETSQRFGCASPLLKC